jgi:hypothetical protein
MKKKLVVPMVKSARDEHRAAGKIGAQFVAKRS